MIRVHNRRRSVREKKNSYVIVENVTLRQFIDLVFLEAEDDGHSAWEGATTTGPRPRRGYLPGSPLWQEKKADHSEPQLRSWPNLRREEGHPERDQAE